MADDVVINIRERGAARAAGQIDRVTGSVNRLGRAGNVAAAGLRNVGTASARAAGTGLRTVGGQAKYAAGGLLAVSAAAGVMGVRFNATMEQSQIAFTNLLGSSAAARREMAWLQKTASSTPFSLPGITDASRQLSAFGFGLKQSNSLLLTLADASAGVGATEDAMSGVVRAIGQIRGKGSLQVEELNQIMEAAPGILNRGKLAKNLGITSAALGDVGNQGVDAARAIRAIQKTMDDSFGGQAKKQAESFNGQISTLKDNVNITLGHVTLPLFERLRKDVLPGVNKGAEQLGKIFARDDLDLSEKLTLSRTSLRRTLGPLTAEIGQEIEDLHLGRRVLDGFEDAVPIVANKLASAGPDVAKAFFNAFMDAGPWGKALMTGVFAVKLSSALGGNWGVRGPVGAGSASNPIAVVGLGGGMPGGAPGRGPIVAPTGTAGKVGKAGRLRGVAGKVGGKALKFGGPAAAVGVAADVLLNPDDTYANDSRPVSEIRAEIAAYNRRHRRGRAAAPPSATNTAIILHDAITLDGRQVGKITRRIEADRKARK